MTIIRCPKCGYTVSDRAPACPKCKLPLRDALKPADSVNPAQLARSPGAPVATVAIPSAPTTEPPSKPPEGRWWNTGSTKSFFGRIESREDALKLIRDASTGFFVVAGLQGLAGVFLAPALLVDAVLYAILAAVLRARQSRVAAVILLVASLIGVVTSFLNRIGATSTGGKNVLLSVIMTIVAVRAVEAAFKLRGRFREDTASPAGAPEDERVPIIVRGRIQGVDKAPGTL